MSQETCINLTLDQESLAATISSLLFSCSVNIMSNTDEEYQRQLFRVAKKLKQQNPQIKLSGIQFLKEENYEDTISSEVYEEFKNNLEVVTFEHI